MLYKTRIFPLGEKVIEMMLPASTNQRIYWQSLMMLAKKQDVDPFLCLSWVSSRTNNLQNILPQRHGNKFACCTACEKYKGLRDSHPMGMEWHSRHQRKCIEHVNNQETHHKDYYNNYALLIMRPNEVMTIKEGLIGVSYMHMSHYSSLIWQIGHCFTLKTQLTCFLLFFYSRIPLKTSPLMSHLVSSFDCGL